MRWPSRVGILCLIALGAILSRPLLHIVQGGETYTILPNLEVDSASYDSFAVAVVNAGSLRAVPPTFPPGFVAIVAAVYATVGHSIVAAKILLWVCLVAATVGTGLLARRVYDSASAGWTAALLTASSAALQAYTGTLQYEVLVAAMILALIGAALVATSPTLPAAVLTRVALFGFALGVAVLVRETVVAFVPVFAGYAAHRVARRTRGRVGLLAGVIVLVCAVAVPLGWSAAESRRVGHAMLVRDNVQGILPFGHNPYANGTWNQALAGVGEPSGVPFIMSEPRLELWLLGRKAMYFWGVLRDGWNVPRPGAVWLARATFGLLPMDLLLPVVRGGWILALLLLACVILRARQWRDYWLLPGLIAALMAVHLATISSHRFAVPILPIAFVMIAGAVGPLLSRVSGWRLAVVAILLAAGAVLQAGEWPLRYRLDPTELDGVNGENRPDPDGRLVRFADAGRGERVAFALYDEFLPSGSLVLRLQARRGAADLPAQTPVARVRLSLLDGSPPCEALMTLEQLGAPGEWTSFALSCTLLADGPARLVVETLGRVDLSFGDAVLQWRRDPSRR